MISKDDGKQKGKRKEGKERGKEGGADEGMERRKNGWADRVTHIGIDDRIDSGCEGGFRKGGTDGQRNGWMERGGMEGGTNGQRKELKRGRVGMNVRMDRQIERDGWMDERRDRGTNGTSV